MGLDHDPDEPDVPAVLLEMDHVFEALGHARRRYVLYTLLADTEWALWELATKLAAWENDVPLASVTGEETERVYVSLYHTHVPKLVEDDIVEFSEATETIEPGPNAEQVLEVLRAAGGSLDSQQERHARRDQNEGRT